MYAKKYTYATGAAQNVAFGFIPDFVKVTNITDGDHIYEGPLDVVVQFTSGGTGELKAGDMIVGVTSGAAGTIREVLHDTGTWAGGNAAGTIIFDPGVTGTFGAENVGRRPQQGADAEGNWATVTAPDNTGLDISAAVALAGANEGLSAYNAGTGQGVTLGSAIGADGELLLVQAWRQGAG